MPRLGTVILSSLPVALVGIMYYHHRRLLASYPTLRVPRSMEISARRDIPAFGISGANKTWLRTHAGDMWAATVPRRLLSSNSAPDSEDTLLLVFARAFFGTWPLRLERHLLGALARMGILYESRGAHVGHEGEHRLVNGARVLGGLAVVDAQQPLVAFWWLRPIAQSRPQKIGLLGGYHSFAVEDDTSESKVSLDGEPTVRLCFASHVIFSAPAPSTGASSIPTSELPGLSLRQRLIMHFHAVYSRILLDLTVGALERGAV
ncbi:hypothetical protein B0H17DRAFT_309737 [Mycena rosella]|uniref:Uncharacterized protein n=1 Tax=Mycena rosella TaxID=1033263 RepID=A0AAD7CU95_MYCRO|nr:hypothetical protein B0H17DRAFT_309737 [Mycena rosella]